MVRERRESQAVCQRCGGARGASRYCPHCGLDFWKAAEEATGGEDRTAAAAPDPEPEQRRLAPIAIGIGVALLGVAALLWLGVSAVGWLFPDREPQPRFAEQPPPAAHPLVLAFYGVARDPDAAYAWRQSGELTVTIPDETLESSIAAVGRADGIDWSTKSRVVENGSATFDGEIVYVGQRAYLREKGDDGWTESRRIPAVQVGPINPFARIVTVAEVSYEGPETRDGVDGHVLTVDKWLSDPEADDPIRRIAHVRSREARMEIFVDADGVPITATYTFALEARTPDGEIVTLNGRNRYAFESWGAVEPIAAPSPATFVP